MFRPHVCIDNWGRLFHTKSSWCHWCVCISFFFSRKIAEQNINILMRGWPKIAELPQGHFFFEKTCPWTGLGFRVGGARFFSKNLAPGVIFSCPRLEHGSMDGTYCKLMIMIYCVDILYVLLFFLFVCHLARLGKSCRMFSK